MLKLILRIYISISLEFMQCLKAAFVPLSKYDRRFCNGTNPWTQYVRTKGKGEKWSTCKDSQACANPSFAYADPQRREEEAISRHGVPVDTHYESFKS